MYPNARALIARLVVRDDGLETVEYAIIVGMVVTATLTAIAAIGVWVSSQYTAFTTTVGA